MDGNIHSFKVHMRAVSVDIEKKKMIIKADFWDIEVLGYDTVKKKVINEKYYSSLLHEIKEIVKRHLGEDFKFGVKSYVDNDNKCFYYEITPYENRLNEFILEEMIREHRSFTFLYPKGID